VCRRQSGAGDRRFHRRRAEVARYRRSRDRLDADRRGDHQRRWKGVSVNVFVEQDYIRTTLKKVPKPPKPDAASGETEAYRPYKESPAGEGFRFLESERTVSACARNVHARPSFLSPQTTQSALK
jgi:hypothetical protein